MVPTVSRSDFNIDVASTPGLALPNKIQLQPYTKARRGASQRAGRSRAIAATELLLQSSTHPKIDYVAREEESGVPDALLKHYVGVYDPDTGKLEVVEARKMVVRGSVRDHQARIEDNMPMAGTCYGRWYQSANYRLGHT